MSRLKNIRKRLFGPSYNDVAEAARAMAQAIVDTAHDRAYDHKFKEVLKSGEAVSLGGSCYSFCTMYADENWCSYVEPHELIALTKFHEINLD